VAQVGLSQEQGERLWTRRREGVPLRAVARELDVPLGVVEGEVARRGGVSPRRPAASRGQHLSLGEREELSRGVAAGLSVRAIARQLSRSASTVSRELGRNHGRRYYRAHVAEDTARERRRRPKPVKLATQPALAAEVAEKLEADWSPQQIAGWLRRQHPERPERRVSHETIYLGLFLPHRRGLELRLRRRLRSGRSTRQPRRRVIHPGRGQLRGAVHFSQRPVEADDRTVAGHWEGDLVLGTQPSAVATVVERHSRFLVLAAMPHGHGARQLRAALAQTMQTLPPEVRRSLTWDNGKEMGDHAGIALDLDMPVFFTDPHSPWQRGSNENTNRLLRQYLPKGTDISDRDQAALDAIAARINTRPREVLGWRSPVEVLTEAAQTSQSGEVVGRQPPLAPGPHQGRIGGRSPR